MSVEQKSPVALVNEASFENEVLRSELPVLVDLYADWCQPCKQLSPIVEEVARELQGKLKVVKVDVERSPTIAQMFRVQSIPMLAVIHQGQLVGRQMGLVNKETILKMVEPVLPTDASEVKPKELAALIGAKRGVAVDIRDKGSYQRYRIPGAIHIDATQLAEKPRDLIVRDGRIRVLYGRSTDEAKALAEQLREKGLEVGFLAGGFLHWEAEGLEVERG